MNAATSPRRAPLRVAVVGCQVGARHARTYRRMTERYELVALCDTNAGRMKALADELGGGIKLERDYTRLLQRGDLDAISICTPPSLHLRQILEALAAGCHVVCEKPIAGSLHDLDVLHAAATQAQRRIVPIFQLRFGAGLQKLKHLVDRGLTGQCYLTTIETAWKRGADYYSIPWRRSWHGSLGGCLLGHAVHAHDMLCHIVGPVARVSAFARTLVNPIEAEDCVSAALEMADGSLATLAVTLGSARELSRMRFCFERLVAESNTHPYEYSSEPWLFTGATPDIDQEISAALAQVPPRPEGYEAQFVGLHEELCHGGPQTVTMEEARDSIELATALYAASERGRIIELPIARDDPAYRGDARPFPRGNGDAAVHPSRQVAAILQ